MARDNGGLTQALKPLTAIAARGLDLIWPPTELNGAPSGGGGLVNGAAWSRIIFLAEPVCDGCGAPFPYEIPPDLDGKPAHCGACLAKRHVFDRCRAACLYDEASRELILPFKHGDRTDLAKLFSAWLARAARPLVEESDLIIEVPVHRWRLLHRRYNQAAEIARPLSRLTGLPHAPGLLKRIKQTDSQGGKSATGRRRNVAAAFDVPEGGRLRLAGKRVLLIDDVLTTGATADACARALKAAGARAVHLAVVARVREMEPRPI